MGIKKRVLDFHFLNQGKWLKLDYDLQPVDSGKIDGQIFVENSKWAEVQEQDFKKKIRKFRQKSETPNKWAKDLRESLLKTHTHAALSDVWDAAMRDHAG